MHVEPYPPLLWSQQFCPPLPGKLTTLPPVRCRMSHLCVRVDVTDSSFLPSPSSCHPFLSFPSSTNSVAATCHPSCFPEEPPMPPTQGLCPPWLFPVPGKFFLWTSLGLSHSEPRSSLATLSRVISLPTVAVSSLVFSCLVFAYITYSLRVLVYFLTHR